MAMATAPRRTLHLVVGAALLSAVLVCWVASLRSGAPSELLASSVRERVANLEFQAKEIENVRQDAKYLDRQIAELEKEGETGKIHQSELQTKAAELRQRLLGLAHQAKMSPSRLLTRHNQQHLAVTKVAAERPMPAHRAIDDPYFKGTYYSTKRSWPSAKEIGALAEVEGTTQDQAHFEHRFGGLGQHGVEAWEVAPKQNEFGEEQHASMSYISRHHKPSWLYAPNEAADGTDAPPGAKPAATKYLHRYGGHGSASPSWAYNPKIGTPAWKVSPKQDDAAAATPAQREASTWFKGLRSSQEKRAGPKAVEIETSGDAATHFGADFTDFRSVLNKRMAKELDTLQAADSAVAAMQRSHDEDIQPDPAQLLDRALREAARKQSKHAAAAAAASAAASSKQTPAQVEGMEKDLHAVEAREVGMTKRERARLGPDVAEMRAALQGARVTAASEQRNEERLAVSKRAAREEEAARGRKAKELRPLTKQALQAEAKVREIKAALALARDKAARAKQRQAMSKLDKLGINTGEVHTQWGGDQVV